MKGVKDMESRLKKKYLLIFKNWKKKKIPEEIEEMVPSVDYDNEEDVSIDVYLDQETDESFDNINEDLSLDEGSEDVDLEDNKNKSSGCGCHIATAE